MSYVKYIFTLCLVLVWIRIHNYSFKTKIQNIFLYFKSKLSVYKNIKNTLTFNLTYFISFNVHTDDDDDVDDEQTVLLCCWSCCFIYKKYFCRVYKFYKFSSILCLEDRRCGYFPFKRVVCIMHSLPSILNMYLFQCGQQ